VRLIALQRGQAKIPLADIRSKLFDRQGETFPMEVQMHPFDGQTNVTKEGAPSAWLGKATGSIKLELIYREEYGSVESAMKSLAQRQATRSTVGKWTLEEVRLALVMLHQRACTCRRDEINLFVACADELDAIAECVKINSEFRCSRRIHSAKTSASVPEQK
jgi:hypothetical protein